LQFATSKEEVKSIETISEKIGEAMQIRFDSAKLAMRRICKMVTKTTLTKQNKPYSQ
jgi:hypothetical protein